MPVDELYEFTVTTPAATPKAAPLVTPAVFPARIVEKIQWRLPAGALGVMGWRISMRGVQVLPKNAGAFIVAHETMGEYVLRNHPDSGDWSVTTYNTGGFPHDLYVTFFAQVIPRPVPLLYLADHNELTEAPDPDWIRA